jgi:hypothetical protein
MTDKFERCIRDVKRANTKRGTTYNPWAVCNATVGRMGGKATKRKVETRGGVLRRVYEGPRGGLFVVQSGRKVYL